MAGNPLNEANLEEADIFYVSDCALDTARAKVGEGGEVSQSLVNELLFPENVPDDEVMVPVDMRGVGCDYDDVEQMVEKIELHSREHDDDERLSEAKLQAAAVKSRKSIVEAFVKAGDYFDANKDCVPAVYRPKSMTAGEWKALLEDDEEEDEDEDDDEKDSDEDEENYTFDGEWTSTDHPNDGKFSHATIDGEFITWANDDVDEIERESRTEMTWKSATANLVDENTIEWDDDDVWRRQDHYKFDGVWKSTDYPDDEKLSHATIKDDTITWANEDEDDIERESRTKMTWGESTGTLVENTIEWEDGDVDGDVWKRQGLEMVCFGGTSCKHSRNGPYSKTNLSPGSENGDRPIYKHLDGKNYLFYWNRSGAWYIGPDYRKSTAAGIRSKSGEKTKTPLEASDWVEFKEVKKWVKNDNIFVRNDDRLTVYLPFELKGNIAIVANGGDTYKAVNCNNSTSQGMAYCSSKDLDDKLEDSLSDDEKYPHFVPYDDEIVGSDENDKWLKVELKPKQDYYKLDGRWKSTTDADDEKLSGAEISDETITWADGTEEEIERTNSTTFEWQGSCATLDGDIIRWNDGDVWRRQDFARGDNVCLNEEGCKAEESYVWEKDALRPGWVGQAQAKGRVRGPNGKVSRYGNEQLEKEIQEVSFGGSSCKDSRHGPYSKKDLSPGRETADRPIYQHRDGKNYLFYWRACAAWKIGPDYKKGTEGKVSKYFMKDTSYIVSKYGEALRTPVGATSWFEFKNVKKWVKNDNIFVRQTEAAAARKAWEEAAAAKKAAEAAAREAAERKKCILFVGNPGTGKSTILNGIIGEPVFVSKMSTTGSGITYQLDKKEVGDNLYMDTPGLSDETMREKAAKAITTALKQDGNYKIFFVITAEAGRVRPDEKATIKCVLEASPQITEYSIIVNKATDKWFTQITQPETLKVWTACLMSGLPTPTASIHFMLRTEELEDCDNVAYAAPDDVIQFVETAPGMVILANSVKKVEADAFKEERRKNAELSKEIEDDKQKAQAEWAKYERRMKAKMAKTKKMTDETEAQLKAEAEKHRKMSEQLKAAAERSEQEHDEMRKKAARAQDEMMRAQENARKAKRAAENGREQDKKRARLDIQNAENEANAAKIKADAAQKACETAQNEAAAANRRAQVAGSKSRGIGNQFGSAIGGAIGGVGEAVVGVSARAVGAIGRGIVKLFGG